MSDTTQTPAPTWLRAALAPLVNVLLLVAGWVGWTLSAETAQAIVAAVGTIAVGVFNLYLILKAKPAPAPAVRTASDE